MGQWRGRVTKSFYHEEKTACAEGIPWKIELRKYLLAYRAVLHTSTGKSPAKMFFGRKLHIKLPDFTREKQNTKTAQRIINIYSGNNRMSKFDTDMASNAQKQ